jgi:serine/threonine protein kinase
MSDAAVTGAPPDVETSNRWERLAAIFESAQVLPDAERAAYVRDRCADPRDRAELETLLAFGSRAPGPVERVMGALGSTAQDWCVGASRTRVGPYEILREIGGGGMGVVYLARRADGLYQRLVALKLARLPVLDVSLRARFLAEREILAGLAHPHIAPLFDGGVTEDGLPYFTMEYVDGLPIDAYCDAHALDLRDRVRLFLSICGAVAAAHRALVVHRDLKPSNVLVTADGAVKLLDFGIAKLLASDAGPAGETVTEARLMTPAYASPEQVRGARVSTATDVYALGLLLYELLSGRPAHRFVRRDAAHLEQIVVETDPMPMTEALASRPDEASPIAEAIARTRQTPLARLRRQLHGDLARITAKALRKDPDQRYASAAHLADDLQRYLDGRPVVARDSSVAYRVARFVRRHRFAVVATALGLFALTGYLGLAIQHGRNLEHDAERKREEVARAQEVTEFVVALFEATDPDVVQNASPTAALMLERGVTRANALDAQPQLQARLLNAIARAYFNLGRHDASAAVATRALAASRRAVGERHADVARDHRTLGLAIGQLGRQRDAVTHFRTALDIRRATGAPADAEVAADLLHLGYSLAQTGALDEAEGHVTESLRLRRLLLPAGHEDIAMSLSGLAFVRGRQGRPSESADLYREALGMRLARLGERHPEVARARHNLASALSTAGAQDEAAAELTRALAAYRSAYGERHPSIATTLNTLGALEHRRRREAAAIGYFRAALDMRRVLLGPDHPSTLLSQANLAAGLTAAGHLEESELLQRDVLARTARRDGDVMGHSRANTMANLAHTLLLRGKLAEAEATAREALALVKSSDSNPLTEASVLATLGRALSTRRKHREAAEVLQQALAIREARLGRDHADTVRVRGLLAKLRLKPRYLPTEAPLR